MAKKLLIDIALLRESQPDKSSDMHRTDGILSSYPNRDGRKSIREQALFRFTCRRCLNAPCVDACPANALEKDDDNMVLRSTNLCIACKSCVVICPFGTIMNDFFEHHLTRENYYELDDEDAIEKFINSNPNGAVRWVDADMEEDPPGTVYKLNELVLVKEKEWNKK
jgi:Fe-S-cluster-containing hydrogenase component 2